MIIAVNFQCKQLKRRSLKKKKKKKYQGFNGIRTRDHSSLTFITVIVAAEPCGKQFLGIDSLLIIP